MALDNAKNKITQYLLYILPCTGSVNLARNLSSAYQTLRRKNGMQYRSICNMFNSFENVEIYSVSAEKIISDAFSYSENV
jgi:hypothetical protein